MVGLIIATSVLATALVAVTTVGAIKMHKINKNMTALAQCLLTHITEPEKMDIVEVSPVFEKEWNFPNTEGGF